MSLCLSGRAPLQRTQQGSDCRAATAGRSHSGRCGDTCARKNSFPNKDLPKCLSVSCSTRWPQSRQKVYGITGEETNRVPWGRSPLRSPAGSPPTHTALTQVNVQSFPRNSPVRSAWLVQGPGKGFYVGSEDIQNFTGSLREALHSWKDDISWTLGLLCLAWEMSQHAHLPFRTTLPRCAALSWTEVTSSPGPQPTAQPQD